MRQTRLPSLSALKAFEAVARMGSMKDASNELHVTPGAVSQLVRKLEDELSIQLFERKNRELCLTEDGMKLSEGALAAFDILKQTVRTLPSNTQESKVSIACEVSIANNWLAPRVGKLLSMFPKLNIEIHTYKSAADIKGVASDLIITTNRADARDADFESMGHEVFSVLASPEYLSKFNLSTGGLIAKSTLISYQSKSKEAIPDWQDWFSTIGLDAEDLGREIGFGDDFDHALIAARNGAGLLLAPLALVSHDIETGRLVCPRGPSIDSDVQYWVATLARTHQPACVENIKQWLVSQMQEALSLTAGQALGGSAGNVYPLRPDPLQNRVSQSGA